MISNNLFQRLLYIVCTLLIYGCSSDSNNWPQFRGPEYNMVINEGNLPTEWSNDQNIKWTYDLTGSSWSSPIIWENKVFITTSFAEKSVSGGGIGVFTPRPPVSPDANDTTNRSAPQPPPTPVEEDKRYLDDIFRWEVTCLDLRTGEELWKHIAYQGNPRIKTHVGNTYASETPVTDGKRVYVYFGMTGVFCYDMDGQLLWQKDLGVYDTQNGWGTGSSPVIYKDILYLQIDNEVSSFLVALKADNGEQLWKVDRDEKTNYSTPIIWENRIRTELITSGKTARSYDPKTGELFWELKLGGEMSIPSPVADEDHLYIGNAGGREVKGTLYSVKAGAAGDITLSEGNTVSSGVEWAVLDAGTGNPSPLLYKGLIYILGSGGGELECYEAATGIQIYKEKIRKVRSCWASPWAYDDKILFIDDRGVTFIIKAGKQFELLSQNELDDTIWASPAMTRDSYIFKGFKRLYYVKI